MTSGDIVEEQGKSYLSLGKSFEETGKRTIKVLHSTDMVGENLTATVEIKGLPDGCSNTVSETMAISIDPGSAVIDEFSISATQIDKNRLELLVKAAKENSSAQIYIIERFEKKFSPKVIQLKSQKTIDYLKSKGIERNYITLLNASSDKNLTQLIIVPAGVSAPVCDDCKIIESK